MQIFMSFTLVKVAQQPLLGSYKVTTYNKGKRERKAESFREEERRKF